MNRQAIERLIEFYKEDSELIEAIQDAMKSFEEYHASIYSMETGKMLLSSTMDARKYQEEVFVMDQKRTRCHNSVLANVSMLNRMAASANLPPVYDGIISQEQPFRRQVADDGMDFIREIILERP